MSVFLVKIVNILYSLGLHFECPKLLLWLGRLAMRIFEKISEFIGKWMAVVVLAVASLSLFAPNTTLWIQLSWVNYLLMVVMFGMGLTLKLSDFALVFMRPKEIILGCTSRFLDSMLL